MGEPFENEPRPGLALTPVSLPLVVVRNFRSPQLRHARKCFVILVGLVGAVMGSVVYLGVPWLLLFTVPIGFSTGAAGALLYLFILDKLSRLLSREDALSYPRAFVLRVAGCILGALFGYLTTLTVHYPAYCFHDKGVLYLLPFALHLGFAFGFVTGVVGVPLTWPESSDENPSVAPDSFRTIFFGVLMGIAFLLTIVALGGAVEQYFRSADYDLYGITSKIDGSRYYVRGYDVQKLVGKSSQYCRLKDKTFDVALSPSGALIALRNRDSVAFISTDRMEEVHRWQIDYSFMGPEGGKNMDSRPYSPGGMAVSSDDKRFALVSNDYQAMYLGVFDVDTGKKEFAQKLAEDRDGESVKILAFSPDDRLLAVADGFNQMITDFGKNAEISLCESSSGKLLPSLFAQDCYFVFDLQFSPDGSRLAALAMGQGYLQQYYCLFIWKIPEGTLLEKRLVKGAPEQVLWNTTQNSFSIRMKGGAVIPALKR